MKVKLIKLKKVFTFSNIVIFGAFVYFIFQFLRHLRIINF